MPRNRKGDSSGESNKPSINNLFSNFEYFIDYDKDGYYVLAHKAKGKKEKVIAMSNSPSQLLTHAYMELNMKSVIYMSDVISYVVDMEQVQLISDLSGEITKNLENFLNKISDKKKTGFSDNIDNGA
jgi:hypothetical protein